MSIFGRHTGLYTDFYEFTMAQGFFLSGKKDMSAGFDYFFRENPFHGGYVVFAGLDDLLQGLDHFSFDDEDLRFLKNVGLNQEFLSFLKGFRFRGRIFAAKEGEIVFPLEPVVRVEGNIIETQLIETLLLNLLNFESLIATKASRIRSIAGDRRIVDFGLRRAQGLGGIQATKASMIGGFDATSHVYAAFRYSLEVSGTQAHSWVQSFDDELSAFRKFAETFPDKCIVLVDTYNTLKSGIPNAIVVAKELEKKGWDVTVLDNLSRPRLLNRDIKNIDFNMRFLRSNFPKIRIIRDDILNANALNEAAKGADVIFHTAAQTAVTTSVTDPRRDFEINALGTLNVLENLFQWFSTLENLL